MRFVALVLAATVAVASAQAGDWSVRRDPFDHGVIARYKEILARDPYDGVLAKLTGLYGRYRTVAQLEDEYRATPDGWATVVVRARLAGNRPAAVELWSRAAALDPHDARAWLALADVTPDRADAEAAIERAVTHAKTPALRRTALRKQIARTSDAKVADRAFAKLLELDPGDAKLWTERGDAQLAARLYGDALASYARAEAGLARDVERRIYVVTQRGLAHEGAGEHDKALDEYRRAIALAPKRYLPVRDIIGRVIELHRKQRRLLELVRQYERDWPVAARGYFEWATLGELYEETASPQAAIAALQQAVAKSPIELATHRRLVKLLDAAHRRTEAVAQLERAARTAPGDLAIQLELAERLRSLDDKRALATLARVAHRLTNNVGARIALAETYTRWGRHDLAMREYEHIVRLEPTEEHIKELGERYMVLGQQRKAVATWQRLARAGTAAAHAHVGQLLADHGLWPEAIEAYSKAIVRDDGNAELWRARSAAHEAAKAWARALSDAEQAVARIGTKSLQEGHAVRQQLVRTRVHADEHQHWNELAEVVTAWHDAFEADPPDVAAGYMLAEFHGRTPGFALARVLATMHELVPGDRGIVLELVRTYRTLGRYDAAKALVLELARRDPSNAQFKELLAQIEAERLRPSGSFIEDPEQEVAGGRRINSLRADRALPYRGRDDATPAVDGGLRIGIGAGLRGPTSRALTLGALGRFGGGPVHFISRLDYSERDGEFNTLSSVALSLGVAGRVAKSEDLALLVGAAQRIEGRRGEMEEGGPWEEVGFAADVTVDLVARRFPATIGARFEQGLSDDARDSSVFLEVGVELR